MLPEMSSFHEPVLPFFHGSEVTDSAYKWLKKHFTRILITTAEKQKHYTSYANANRDLNHCCIEPLALYISGSETPKKTFETNHFPMHSTKVSVLTNNDGRKRQNRMRRLDRAYSLAASILSIWCLKLLEDNYPKLQKLNIWDVFSDFRFKRSIVSC